MSSHRWALAVVVSLALVSVAPQANGAAGTPIATCGQTAMTNAYLAQDLYCAGPGMFVGAAGITIDLRGFTMRGTNNGIYAGIANQSFDNVTIKNGVVRNFYEGVIAVGGTDSFTVTNVTATGNSDVGIYIAGVSATVKSSFGAGNGNHGIEILGDNATVKASSATGNRGNGFWVQGSFAKVQSSTASGNWGSGIDLDGDGFVVKGNRADGNGFTSGTPPTSDTNGLGISASYTTTPPSGKNTSGGNDDPAECFPAYLC